MVEPLSTTQDFNWITRRYSELQRKYPSQYVAVKNRRVIAHGHDAGKVYLKAKRDVKKDFLTAYILSGDPFVLNAARFSPPAPSIYSQGLL
jgi:hypothetical protein